MELMVVLAVVAVLTTLSVSNLIACLPRYKLGEAATDILSFLRKARQRALKENRRVVVLFDPDGDGCLDGDYMAFVDNGDGGTGEWTRQKADGEPLVAGGQLPQGVKLSHTSLTRHHLRFDGRGHLMDINRSITIENSNGVTKKIIVYASGNCRVD
jgi:Tfp pilus assembly protein FimT